MAVASTGDPDLDAAAGPQRAAPSVAPTWGNALKGVGQSALALGSGTLKALDLAANDILPGEENRKKLAAEIETDPVLNYKAGPEAQPIMDALGIVAKPISNAAQFAHNAIAGVTNERTAQIAGDVGTLASSYGRVGATAPAAAADTALTRAQKLGYVVPPATSNPNIANSVAEGFAGKLTTAQAASMRNQSVTNRLVRSELGLPEDAPLTSETLDGVRSSQSPAYEAIKAIPDIKFGPDYASELDKLTGTANKITATLPNYRSTGSEQVKSLIDSLKPAGGVMDGETAVELSKSLRSEASSYELAASRTGDPQSRTLARAYRGSAEAVENSIESHLNDIGKPELAKDWDDARRTIAKTYSVQNALDGAGNVDATKLGKQLLKGKPLSGNLEAAADFANSYPKAARTLKESVPGMSPLDVYGGAAMEAVTGNPLALAVGPARMAARSALLSPLGQKMARPGAIDVRGAVAPSLTNFTALRSLEDQDQGRLSDVPR